MHFAITGATGHIGRRLAEILLGKRHKVRVIGRSADGLMPLTAAGAEACVGSLEDGSFLARAFGGTDAVFAMIPPNPQAPAFREFQNSVGASTAAAVKKAGVKRVVNLSSQGADLPEGTGPIVGLHDQEQRLNAMKDADVVHLRPSFFMENLMMNMNLIHSQGINGTPMRGDLLFPAIATRDIAAAAADCLLGMQFPGKSVYDLLGERDLSMNEITRILGKAIGKPDLPYVQFPYDAAEKAMASSGLSQDLARLYIEMHRAFNEGRIMHNVRRTPDNTTPTSIEEFAKTFAAAYKIAFIVAPPLIPRPAGDRG